MSKEKNSAKGAQRHVTRKFNIAYSINNWQPVQCTHISDQPFFYMEEECDLEDMLLEEEFSDALFGEDLERVKQQIKALEHTIIDRKEIKQERTKEFLCDAEYISQKQYSKDSELKDIQALIAQSAYGKALLAHAKNIGVEITSSQETQMSSFCAKSKTILIDKNIDNLEQIIRLSMELRRMWQDDQGANLNPLSLHPDYAILVNRAQKADLALSVIRIAWELKLQRENALWDRLKNSSLCDLVSVFEREARFDFRSLNNGKASSAVFETWFLSERCATEDKTLVQDMLAEHKNYKVDFEDNNEANILSVLTAIGAQPTGRNYLTAYASYIMNDGLFTEVRERSTANFLWFIKFEQRFEEAECELQSSTPIKIKDTQQYKNKRIFSDTKSTTAIEQPIDNVVSLWHERKTRR